MHILESNQPQFSSSFPHPAHPAQSFQPRFSLSPLPPIHSTVYCTPAPRSRDIFQRRGAPAAFHPIFKTPGRLFALLPIQQLPRTAFHLLPSCELRCFCKSWTGPRTFSPSTRCHARLIPCFAKLYVALTASGIRKGPSPSPLKKGGEGGGPYLDNASDQHGEGEEDGHADEEAHQGSHRVVKPAPAPQPIHLARFSLLSIRLSPKPQQPQSHRAGQTALMFCTRVRRLSVKTSCRYPTHARSIHKRTYVH